ncbi:MAG: hypothetical protein R3E82_18890 [Pseudomonadales bacterium]|nr:hypothetical protein [Pseudomonadales bacterium]
MFKKTLFLAVTWCFAASVVADPVSVRYGFSTDGPPAALIDYIKQASAVQNKLNPGTQPELWLNTFHGPNTSGGSVVVQYPSMEAFAAATKRNQESAEWAAALQKMPASAQLRYTGLSNVLWQEADAKVAAAGEVMMIFTFEVLQGGTAPLVEFAKKAAATQGTIGVQSTFRVVAPTLSGDNVGTATVLVRYPNLTAYAEGTTKLAGNKTWQDLLATFPAANYRISYTALSTAAAL